MNSTQQQNMQRTYRPKKVSLLYLSSKRFFDIFSSLMALILLSPLMLIIAILVKAEDGGKIFYSHKRVGKGGKTIYIHKFRSMVRDSQDLEHLLTPEQLKQYNTEFKIDNDPRITKTGKFLRTTSLDELPQLWDIFVGKISVIGPRPLVEEEIKKNYPQTSDILLSCKPGLTGYWQAYARNDATYESGERQQMELYYIENCSFWLDVKILFKTVVSVLKRKGAK